MEDGASPPYWQLPATVTLCGRGRSSLSSVFLNSSLAIILIPSLAFLLILLFAPSLSSQSYSQATVTSKSAPAKSGWEVINVVLVVFAIFSGILARTDRYESAPPQELSHGREIVGGEGSMRNDRMQLNRFFGEEKTTQATPATGVSQLRRNASSYPDLRTADSGEPFRFFDDFDLSGYVHHQQLRHEISSSESSDAREIPVETFVVRSERHSPSPSSPVRVQSDRKPGYKNSWKERVPETPAPNPPPTPPEEEAEEAAEKERRKELKNKKRNIASKDNIATAIASLYSGRRRKRKRNQKIIHDFDASVEDLPPPPPPPPTPSVFHSLFKKRNKSKKIHSLSTPQPQPQPPPPPPQSLKQKYQRTQLPPPPPPPHQPPPPPQPPITPSPPPSSASRSPEANGGSARVWGSRGEWREMGDVDDGEELDEMDGEDEIGPMAGEGGPTGWPSPDVNVKADTFIARHHEGWKLEKLKSRRERDTRWADEDAYWAHLGP